MASAATRSVELDQLNNSMSSSMDKRGGSKSKRRNKTKERRPLRGRGEGDGTYFEENKVNNGGTEETMESTNEMSANSNGNGNRGAKRPHESDNELHVLPITEPPNPLSVGDGMDGASDSDTDNLSMVTAEGGDSSAFQSFNEDDDDENKSDTTLDDLGQDEAEEDNSQILLSDGELEANQDEDEAGVINASLIVNVSSKSNNLSQFNISSFTSKSDNDTASFSTGDESSSLSSSRSAPPDLDHADRIGLHNPTQSSTPVSVRVSTNNGHMSTAEMESQIKKKNHNVTFSDNVDVAICDEYASTEVPADTTASSSLTSIDNSQAEADKISLSINEPSFSDASSNSPTTQDAVLSDKKISVENEPVITTAATADLSSSVSDVNRTVDGYEADVDAADEEVQEINANVLLPNTVTELIAENGVKVFIVGTAHFSEQSQQDVMDTIQKVQPTLVLLELCHSRRNILTLDEETILREAADMSLQKVKSALAQSGTVQGTLHLLLLSMSAQLTKKLGMAPGGEFRAAMREARTIPGCVVLLGDRPFKVTLARALAALNFGQKMKLAWQFLTCNEDITREEIERCKEKDLLERMLTEMTGEFPAITRVFVNERDTYLAHSLWLAATSHAHANQGGPIVGVVGMGHIAGIVRNWGRTTEDQIADLVSIPERSLTSVVIGKVVKFSFYALVAYGACKVSRRVFDFPSESLLRSAWQRIPQIASYPIAYIKK